MSESFVHYSLLYGVDAISVLITAVVIWRRRPRWAPWIWSAAALLALAFVARTAYRFQTREGWGSDFKLARTAGAYAWEGKDPYTMTGLLPPRTRNAPFITHLVHYHCSDYLRSHRRGSPLPYGQGSMYSSASSSA